MTRQVDSVCPYCGVGCQLTWNVGPNDKGEERIHFVTGRDGPANHGRLCVKGRYGVGLHPQPGATERDRSSAAPA